MESGTEDVTLLSLIMEEVRIVLANKNVEPELNMYLIDQIQSKEGLRKFVGPVE